MGVFKRNGFYWIDYYDANGKRHRKKVSPSKVVAETVLRDTQVKVSKGEYLGILEERKTTFKEFVPIYEMGKGKPGAKDL